MSADYEELKAAAECVVPAYESYKAADDLLTRVGLQNEWLNQRRRFEDLARPNVILQLLSDLSAAQTALAEARETNRSLNRRVQRAERQVRREPSQQAFWWSQRQTRRWLLAAMNYFDKLRDAEVQLSAAQTALAEAEARAYRNAAALLNIQIGQARLEGKTVPERLDFCVSRILELAAVGGGGQGTEKGGE